MRVKPVDPNAVIRDPHTKRQLPPEGGEVPEDVFWTRRLLFGEVVRIPDDAPSVPIFDAPIPPLTTR